MSMFTGEQIAGVIRMVIGVVSGYFIAQGFGDAEMWVTVAAGAAAFVGAVWSWFSNKPAV